MTTAWMWLKEELTRRLGEEAAEEVWREYWRLNAFDNERRKVQRQQARIQWKRRRPDE